MVTDALCLSLRYFPKNHGNIDLDRKIESCTKFHLQHTISKLVATRADRNLRNFVTELLDTAVRSCMQPIQRIKEKIAEPYHAAIIECMTMAALKLTHIFRVTAPSDFCGVELSFVPFFVALWGPCSWNWSDPLENACRLVDTAGAVCCLSCSCRGDSMLFVTDQPLHYPMRALNAIVGQSVPPATASCNTISGRALGLLGS